YSPSDCTRKVPCHRSLPSGCIIERCHCSEVALRYMSRTVTASCPSVNTSASTTTLSPTVRLMGKRPQSTRGVMVSMTTRILVTTSLAFADGSLALRYAAAARLLPGCQYQRAEWRQAQVQGVKMSVRGQRSRLDGAEIAETAAPVLAAIAVQPFTPDSATRHADLVVVARDRCEIERHQREISRTLALAQVDQHAGIGVVAIDPLEAVGREVQFVERRCLTV